MSTASISRVPSRGTRQATCTGTARITRRVADVTGQLRHGSGATAQCSAGAQAGGVGLPHA